MCKLSFSGLIELLQHYNSSGQKGKIECFCAIGKTNSKTCTKLDKKNVIRNKFAELKSTFFQTNFKFSSITEIDFTSKRKYLNNVNFKILFMNSIAKSKFENFYTSYCCNFEIPCNCKDVIYLHIGVQRKCVQNISEK